MPKKKKTRKQKILADSRRQKSYSNAVHFSPAQKLDTEEKSVPSVPLPQRVSSPSLITTDYRYITTDLLKTIIVTAAIVVIELLLKFLVKNL